MEACDGERLMMEGRILGTQFSQDSQLCIKDKRLTGEASVLPGIALT